MHLLRKHVYLSRALVLLAIEGPLGCSNSSTHGSSSTESGTLAVIPSAVTVVAGGTPTVFNAQLKGSTAMVNWTLNGPGSLSSATGASISYTPPASVTSATNATVTAQAGSLKANATASVEPAGSLYALPPDRATLWQPGVTYNGGIPDANWPVYQTVPCANTADDLANIGNALAAGHAAYPNGVVIELAQGTCNLNGGTIMISTDKTVLRGAGAGATILAITNGASAATSSSGGHLAPAVIIGSQRWSNDSNDSVKASVLLASDATQGSYSVTVTAGSEEAFAVGQYVKLDETSGAAWQTDVAQTSYQVLASPDFRVQYSTHNPSLYSTCVASGSCNGSCGGAGETCCSTSNDALTCNGGYTCSSSSACTASTGCGDLAQSCCAGGSCNAGLTCSSGTCTSSGCGGSGQSCCINNVCNPGYVCCNGFADDPFRYPTTPSASNNYAGTGTAGDAASWFSRQDRPTAEIHQIASCGASTQGATCTSSTVTFTTPIHISYRVSHYAQLSNYSLAWVTSSGVENLTVTGADDDGIDVQWAGHSWVKNVEVTRWTGVGVNFVHSFQCELRDSYIHDADWPVPGGGGYAMGSAFGSSEYLWENNISLRANKVMVSRASGAGAVVAYNYADEGLIGSGPTEEPGYNGFIEVGVNGSHMVGSHHTLFEGNWGFNFDSDTTHGNSIYHVALRNYFQGWRSPFTSTIDGQTYLDTSGTSGPYRAVGLMTYSYWFSFVGNVLGTPAMSGSGTGWVYDTSSGFQAMMQPSIWMLGWNAGNTAVTGLQGYLSDPDTASSTLRDGNWDGLNQEQCWHGIGGRGPCATTAPAPVIPDSWYLGGRPPFFDSTYCTNSSCPWPWVDPTTGTLYTLPAKARYDAGTPNLPR